MISTCLTSRRGRAGGGRHPVPSPLGKCSAWILPLNTTVHDEMGEGVRIRSSPHHMSMYFLLSKSASICGGGGARAPIDNYFVCQAVQCTVYTLFHFFLAHIGYIETGVWESKGCYAVCKVAEI
jgi:hypothetical protein